MTDTPRHLITVGVDGSESSLRAVRFALDEAARRGGTVRAVLAWEIPAMVGDAMSGGMAIDPSMLEEGARAQLTEALEAACPDEAERASIEQHVVMGAPATVLIDEAKGADLLVVGSRGHGGFLDLLLGSVAHQVVTHATCPVVVIPHQRG